MHGRESASDDVLVQDGPAVFFFVIFGLAFEALSSSPPHSVLVTSNHDTTMVAALQALKCLINPKYSGNAMMETTTFEELISLCYRLAMTESATVQIRLIDLLITLSLDKDQAEGQNAKSVVIYHTYLPSNDHTLKQHRFKFCPSAHSPYMCIYSEAY
jgi:hypothetical protein